MSSKSRINVEVWLPVVLLTAGLIWFLVVPTWRNIRDSLTATGWSQTRATVIQSKAVESYSQERRRTTYVFEYKYRVGDKDFTSRRYSFRFASGDQSTAVKRHSRGDEITVYYDPDNPSHSVVDRDSSPWWNYLVLAFVVLIPIAFSVRYVNVMRVGSR